MSDKDRNLLLTTLRSKIEFCKEKFHAQQSEIVALCEQFKSLYYQFDFDDFIKSNQYIFDEYYPILIDSSITRLNEWSECESLINQKRQEVIEEVYQNHGINGIEAILINCEKPDIVGLTIYCSELKNTLLNTMLEWLDNEDNQKECAKGYIRALAAYDFEYSFKLLSQNNTWTFNQKVNYLLLLPLNKLTLEVIDSLPSSSNAHFWLAIENYWILDNDANLIPLIAKKLLINKRPIDAINLINRILRNTNIFETLDNQLIADILIAAANKLEKSTQNYIIVKLIELIQNQGVLNKDVIKQIEWLYFPLEIKPLYLIDDVVTNPETFVELKLLLYKKEKTENLSDAQKENLVHRAYKFFNELNVLPASNGNNIDEQGLLTWINRAREILQTEIDSEFSDYIIGQYLAHSPIGKDDIWPHEAVRAVIEHLESESLEKAIFSGKYNLRGITVRPAYGGGEQEHELAKKYTDDANAIQFTYPRTAKILRNFAKDYEQQGKNEDINVELAP